MTKILIVTGDKLAPKMAGPGIRALELARQISTVADVRLVSTLDIEAMPVDFGYFLSKSKKSLKEHVSWSDVVITQGFVLALNPWILRMGKVLVSDLYDPMHLEHLEDSSDGGLSAKSKAVQQTLGAIAIQIRHSDFFLCASEKQRDMWLGHLAALGRVNPENYEKNQSLRSLIDVVPFGISREEPLQKSHALKGTWPGIEKDDRVVIWGGGIYNWFDPLTLIRAVGVLSSTRPSVKLFFMGIGHPNPHFIRYEMTARAQHLSDELGLTDKHVFFNPGWVEFDSRADYLLDADLGVSTHFDHLETAFSFRTRMLDYLWAGLPILSSSGDAFADFVEEYGLGRVVPPEDVEGLARAMETLLFDSNARVQAQKKVQSFRQRLLWDEVCAPLLAFCREPRRAPDLAVQIRSVPLDYRIPSWVENKARAVRVAYSQGGTSFVIRKVIQRMGQGK